MTVEKTRQHHSSGGGVIEEKFIDRKTLHNFLYMKLGSGYDYNKLD